MLHLWLDSMMVSSFFNQNDSVCPHALPGTEDLVARGEGAVRSAKQWGGQRAASPSSHQKRCAATSRGS